MDETIRGTRPRCCAHQLKPPTKTQLHTVEEWVRNTREPYAWRVGSRIGDGLGKAQMELLIAIATLQQPRPTMPTDHDTSRKAIYRLLGFGI